VSGVSVKKQKRIMQKCVPVQYCQDHTENQCIACTAAIVWQFHMSPKDDSLAAAKHPGPYAVQGPDFQKILEQT